MFCFRQIHPKSDIIHQERLMREKKMEFRLLEHCKSLHLRDDPVLEICSSCRKVMCKICSNTHGGQCTGQTDQNKRKTDDLTASLCEPRIKKPKNNDNLQQSNAPIDTKLHRSSSTTVQSLPEKDTARAFPMCNVHSLSKDMFCISHCTLLCQGCKAEYHESCIVKLVTDVCNRLDHTTVTEYKKWLNSLRVSAIHIQQLLRRNLESVEKQQISALSNLDAYLSKANQNLGRAFNDAKSEIERTFESHSSENSDNISKIETIAGSLDRCLKDAMPLEGSKMDINLFLKLVHGIDEYNSMNFPTEMKSLFENLKKVTYSFGPNTRFQPLSTQNQSLGHVKTNETKLSIVNSTFNTELSHIFSKAIDNESASLQTCNERDNLHKANKLNTTLSSNGKTESGNASTYTTKRETTRKDFTATATGQYAINYMNRKQNLQRATKSGVKDKGIVLHRDFGNKSATDNTMLSKTPEEDMEMVDMNAMETRLKQQQQKPSATFLNINAFNKQGSHTGEHPNNFLVVVTPTAETSSASCSVGPKHTDTQLTIKSIHCIETTDDGSIEAPQNLNKTLHIPENINKENNKVSDQWGMSYAQTRRITNNHSDGINYLQTASSLEDVDKHGNFSELESPAINIQTNKVGISSRSKRIIHDTELSGQSSINKATSKENEVARTDNVTKPYTNLIEGQENNLLTQKHNLVKSTVFSRHACNLMDRDRSIEQQNLPVCANHLSQNSYTYNNTALPLYTIQKVTTNNLQCDPIISDRSVLHSLHYMDNCAAEDLSKTKYTYSNTGVLTGHCDSNMHDQTSKTGVATSDYNQYSMSVKTRTENSEANALPRNASNAQPSEYFFGSQYSNDVMFSNNDPLLTTTLPMCDGIVKNVENSATTPMVNTVEKKHGKKLVFTGLNVESVSKKDISMASDQRQPFITGCIVMPDDRIILCDWNNKNLKVLDSLFTIQCSLDLLSTPGGISVVDATTAIVTLPYGQQLQYVNVTDRLTLGTVIQLDMKCWGVHVVDSSIYVTCFTPFLRKDCEIRILDLNGNVRKRLNLSQDKTYIFQCPYYMKVSARTKRMYVSDWDQDAVTCMNPDGAIVYQYKDPEMRYPHGLCVDDEDNAIVCGEDSDNIHIVTAAGERSSIIRTADYGIYWPQSVAYRRSDKTLIVGCYDNENLYVIQLTET